MARYIDADEALRMMRNSKEDKPSRGDWDIAHDCCIDCVNGALTADVVAVVRCEKCKYGNVSVMSRTKDGKEDIACYCNLENKVRDIDWYCPSGERRDT